MWRVQSIENPVADILLFTPVSWSESPMCVNLSELEESEAFLVGILEWGDPSMSDPARSASHQRLSFKPVVSKLCSQSPVLPRCSPFHPTPNSRFCLHLVCIFSFGIRFVSKKWLPYPHATICICSQCWVPWSHLIPPGDLQTCLFFSECVFTRLHLSVPISGWGSLLWVLLAEHSSPLPPRILRNSWTPSDGTSVHSRLQRLSGPPKRL